jgi:serine/threonine protein kinase/tetratricopeptide (TPR) repeat protein
VDISVLVAPPGKWRWTVKAGDRVTVGAPIARATRRRRRSGRYTRRPMFDPVPLGAFELRNPIDRGAMGEVWAGVHVRQQIPVAVKLILPDRSHHKGFRALFQHEVRQMARLEHRGIVLVLDQGEVSAAAESASGGRIRRGSPYMVMEHVSGGTLARHIGRGLPWRDAERVLLGLLDALAHAHALGVLHRDIKPANLLVATAGDLRPGLKLSDFGVAHAWREETRLKTGGTPHYMAPELIDGDVARQGPWTDLYAVGCLAYDLLTGSPPFHAEPSVPAIYAAHRGAPRPRIAVAGPPHGFHDWLDRMLRPDPRERFHTASDAGWALRNLAEDQDDALWASTLDFDPLDGAHTLPTLYAELVGEALPDRPPVPPSWRAAEPPRQPMRLVDAGLGAFELRRLPLLGREELRDGLWQALRRVHDTGTPEVVVLRGSNGYGKTALGQWLAIRAAELGAASPVDIRHGPSPGVSWGVQGMLARELRTLGSASEAEALERIGAAVAMEGADPLDVEALARVCLGTGGRTSDTPEATTALVGRWLRAKAAERPVVLLVEDAQWGADTLDLLRRLLTAAPDLRALVIVTYTHEESPTSAASGEALAALVADGATEVTVGPLPESVQAALVDELLHLQGDLAELVTRQSSGNPAYAVELVRDWVRRGVLRSGPTGFQLQAGETPRIPDGLYDVWRGRVEAALAGAPAGAHDALHVAAALGLELLDDEWQAVCSRLGLSPAPAAAERLAATRLIERRERGWAFAHEMVRATLQRWAEDAGAWERINAACADHLAGTAPARGRAQRVGYHRVAARRWADAIEPLAQGTEEALASGALREARRILDVFDAALDQVGASPDDARRAAAALLRVRLHHALGELEQADRLAARAFELGRRLRAPLVQARAVRFRGMAAEKRGDLGLADAMFSQAETLAQAGGDAHETAAALEHRGTIARMRGEADLAVELLGQARDLFASSGSELGVADCLKELGAAWASTPDRAEPVLREAVSIYDRLGSITGAADALNNLGDILARRGDLDGAERAFRQAREAMVRVGAHGRLIPALNLALLLVKRRRYAEGREELESALAELRRRRRKVLEAYAHAALLPCAAAAADWAAWDAHLSEATLLLEETGLVDPDIRGLVEDAQRIARAAGERARADQAEAIRTSQGGGGVG